MLARSDATSYRVTEYGLIPLHWEIVRLGDHYDFQNGVNAEARAYGRGVPFANVLEVITNSHLRIGDIPGRVTLAKEIVRLFALRRGDVLFNRTSETLEEVGLTSVYIDNAEAVFGGFVIRARPTSNAFEPLFVGYAFRAPLIRSQITAKGQGAVRANIGQGNLKAVSVLRPPLQEQQAIAEALSDADALIESLEALIAKKYAIKQGAMQELLSGQRRLPGFAREWTSRSLGEFGSTYGGLTGKTKKDFGHGSARYVTFVNVIANTVINPDGLEFVDVGLSETQNRVAGGDLLFNGSSETPREIAMCALVGDDVAGAFLNSFCFGFRPNRGAEIDTLFLTYYFRSQHGRELVKALAQGAIRYNVSKTHLLQLMFPMPELGEQQEIGAVLSDIDKEIDALEEKHAKAGQIKQGMMQELLTGRVRLT